MASSLDGVAIQFAAMGLPSIRAHEIRVDSGRFERYGPQRKAYYKIFSHETRLGNRVYVGTFGYKGDGPWKVEVDGEQALSAEELQELREKQIAIAAQEANRRERDAKRAAGRAKYQWSVATVLGESEYLVGKGIAAKESIRFSSAGEVLVPLIRYDRGELIGLQKIIPDGTKRFNRGMDKVGAACRLGDMPADGEPFLIAEGYATAASCRVGLDFNVPVFMALDTGNLLPVANILRALFPRSPILFAADDDYLTGDAGRRYAEQAAAKIGNAGVLLPQFSIERAKTKDEPNYLNDFNDLHIAEGLGVVAEQLQTAILNVSLPVDASVPAPLELKAAAVGGEGSGDELKGLAYLLSNCRGVYGSGDMWDAKQKVLLNGPAQKAAFGKEIIDEWRRSELRAKDISKQAVKVDLADENSGGMNERFRMIVGGAKSEIWDSQRRCRLPLNVIEDEFPNEFDMWHKHPLRRLRDIEAKNIVFDPTCSVDENYFVNTFKGLPLQLSPHLETYVARAKAKPIIDLLLQLCNGNVDHHRWVMQWLAFPLVNNFKKKHGSALLFHSNIHGSGKSLLFEGIYSAIYGEYAVTAGAKELESQYNGWRSNKLFCLFEEVLTPKEKMQQSGNIKQMITAGKVLVSEKFLSTWEEANHMAVAFLSNELKPLPVEPHDRRLFVIWPEKKLLTEEEVSGPDELTVEKVLNCIDDGGVESFYKVLMSVDLHDFDSFRPPMTPAKAKLIRYGRTSAETFAKLWSENKIEYAPFLSCTTPQLVAAYKNWCVELSLGVNSGNSLAMHIGSLPGVVHEDRKHWRHGEHQRRQPFYVVGTQPAQYATEQDWLGQCRATFADKYDKYARHE